LYQAHNSNHIKLYQAHNSNYIKLYQAHLFYLIKLYQVHNSNDIKLYQAHLFNGGYRLYITFVVIGMYGIDRYKYKYSTIAVLIGPSRYQILF
jgi:hypothetical protein